MREAIKMPRLVIAAPQGQSGKTTVTLGLLGALTAEGLKVQPFKKGPDYIDPSWLSAMARRTCRNLDCYLLDDHSLNQGFIEVGRDADLSIIEGAMGLYDGLDQEGSGSTAQIAKKLDAPVILVIDCRRVTRSAAAMVMGFQHFDPDVKIAGVILNNVARTRHQNMLSRCIEDYCGLPILGVVPKNSGIRIPNRHLGLVTPSENAEVTKIFQTATALMLENSNLAAILELANKASHLVWNGVSTREKVINGVPPKIGVFRDQAFSFYYPENLEALTRAGAELIFIDTLNQSFLPDIDGLFIGGGFPELFAEGLANNQKFMYSLKKAIEDGLPVYAECGGMIYLGRSVIVKGNQYPMVGALPFDGVLENKPQGHGYTLLETVRPNPFFPIGTMIKGHEFHNTSLINLDLTRMELACQVQRGYGINGKQDGLVYKSVFASYNHIHALGTKEWAPRFVNLSQSYQQKKTKDFVVKTG